MSGGAPAGLAVVTLMNKEDQYASMVKSLSRQAEPGYLQFLPIQADKNKWNAAVALNHGLDRAESDWVVCVHQDVVFPDGWLERFKAVLAALEPDAAVLGLVGYTPRGTFVGHVQDPHGHSRWGRMPSAAESIDEHLMAVRKSSGLRFDPETPGFLFYGTDICLAARKAGLKALVVDAPVVHLSAGRTDTKFDTAADWLLAKWGPSCRGYIPTPYLWIGKWNPLNTLKYLRVKRDYGANLMAKKRACGCGAVAYSPLG